jgi:hypothetical protein
VFFLLNAAFAMTIVDLISRVGLASFAIMLPTYLKYSVPAICFDLSLFVSGEGTPVQY